MVKKAGGENTKKVAGNSKKAQADAEKQAAADAKKAQEDANDWSVGAKSNSKKYISLPLSQKLPFSSRNLPRYTPLLLTYDFLENREAEAAKKAEQARKKAEKDAIIAAEEKEARVAPKNTKAAAKKTASKGLDLTQLDEDAPKEDAAALNATGIDDALDALDITTGAGVKIDKHPERRFKAAFAAYEERRLDEMDKDGSGQGLRQNQKREKIKKEFEKSPENPFNQVNAQYNASKEDVEQKKREEKAKLEARLASPNAPLSPK